MMELTKTKLNKILKNYKFKLIQHNIEWQEHCNKVMKRKDLGNGQIEINMPSIYDHEQHNSKGNQLFKDLMAEFEKYEVFPKKYKSVTQALVDYHNGKLSKESFNKLYPKCSIK